MPLGESTLKRLVGQEPFPQPPVIRTQYPVVLMHGFGLLAGLRRGGHLHDEAMNLRRHGVLAYAPNVASYNTVEVRAAMWKERLQTVLRETGVERLSLIAHSMGGLDARYLISVLEMHDRIATLVTVATPHHGTTLADMLLSQPERLRTWIVELANWMGTNALEGATADMLTALNQLTPAYICETFNPAVPDHPSVTYHSYAAAAGKGTDIPVNPWLMVGNAWVYQREGPNDGMVSVESATWGTFLGTIDADHAQEVGIQGLSTHSFDSNAFYRSIVERIAEEA